MNVKNGALLIVKKDDLPQVESLFDGATDVLPSDNGIVRVVRVKTAKLEYVRPTVKIILLECNFDNAYLNTNSTKTWILKKLCVL